jgi:hypothetical protein
MSGNEATTIRDSGNEAGGVRRGEALRRGIQHDGGVRDDGAIAKISLLIWILCATVRGARMDYDELEDRIGELEQRIDRLEAGDGSQAGDESSQAGGVVAYLLGTIIAVVLSWSRNASILWCIFHGIWSWLYVVYFAFTR